MESGHSKNSEIKTAKKRRFADISDEQKKRIKEERNAKNTHRATMSAITILNEYIVEKNLPPLDSVPDEDLPCLLENFYCAARTKGNDFYKTGSFKTLRSNINQYFKEKRGINICADASFTEANIMFKSMQVQAKKIGKGTRSSTLVICEDDMLKIGAYFNTDYVSVPDPYRLRETVMFYIIYFFCRRGQENLYKMKKNHFVLRFDNGERYIEQNVDELDKNHRENWDR